MRTVVQRRFVGQLAAGDFGDHVAVILHDQPPGVGDDADRDRIQAPLVEDAEDLVFAALFGDQQHALLRFAEHDLVRRHAGFALRHVLQIDFDAGSRRGCPSRRWNR